MREEVRVTLQLTPDFSEATFFPVPNQSTQKEPQWSESQKMKCQKLKSQKPQSTKNSRNAVKITKAEILKIWGSVKSQKAGETARVLAWVSDSMHFYLDYLDLLWLYLLFLGCITFYIILW
jgi:hypothetical protein